MITYRLNDLMQEWERKEVERLTFRKLGEMTGLSPDTLNRMANQKTKRVDHSTIETLLKFFRCRHLEELMIYTREEE